MAGSDIDRSAFVANLYNTPEYEPILESGYFDNLDNLTNAFINNPPEQNAVDDNRLSDEAFNELFMPTKQEAPMDFSAFRPSAEPARGSRGVELQPRWDNPSYNAGAGHQEIKE